MIVIIFSWIATILAIAGNLCINRRKTFGFYFFVISNTILVILAIKRFDWSQVALWSVYQVLAIDGIIKWYKMDKINKNNKL